MKHKSFRIVLSLLMLNLIFMSCQTENSDLGASSSGTREVIQRFRDPIPSIADIKIDVNPGFAFSSILENYNLAVSPTDGCSITSPTTHLGISVDVEVVEDGSHKNEPHYTCRVFGFIDASATLKTYTYTLDLKNENGSSDTKVDINAVDPSITKTRFFIPVLDEITFQSAPGLEFVYTFINNGRAVSSDGCAFDNYPLPSNTHYPKITTDATVNGQSSKPTCFVKTVGPISADNATYNYSMTATDASGGEDPFSFTLIVGNVPGLRSQAFKSTTSTDIYVKIDNTRDSIDQSRADACSITAIGSIPVSQKLEVEATIDVAHLDTSKNTYTCAVKGFTGTEAGRYTYSISGKGNSGQASNSKFELILDYIEPFITDTSHTVGVGKDFSIILPNLGADVTDNSCSIIPDATSFPSLNASEADFSGKKTCMIKGSAGNTVNTYNYILTARSDSNLSSTSDFQLIVVNNIPSFTENSITVSKGFPFSLTFENTGASADTCSISGDSFSPTVSIATADGKNGTPSCRIFSSSSEIDTTGDFLYTITADGGGNTYTLSFSLTVIVGPPRFANVTHSASLLSPFSFVLDNLGSNAEDCRIISPAGSIQASVDVTFDQRNGKESCRIYGTSGATIDRETLTIYAWNQHGGENESQQTILVTAAGALIFDYTHEINNNSIFSKVLSNFGDDVSEDISGCELTPLGAFTFGVSVDHTKENGKFTCRVYTDTSIDATAGKYQFRLTTTTSKSEVNTSIFSLIIRGTSQLNSLTLTLPTSSDYSAILANTGLSITECRITPPTSAFAIPTATASITTDGIIDTCLITGTTSTDATTFVYQIEGETLNGHISLATLTLKVHNPLVSFVSPSSLSARTSEYIEVVLENTGGAVKNEIGSCQIDSTSSAPTLSIAATSDTCYIYADLSPDVTGNYNYTVQAKNIDDITSDFQFGLYIEENKPSLVDATVNIQRGLSGSFIIKNNGSDVSEDASCRETSITPLAPSPSFTVTNDSASPKSAKTCMITFTDVDVTAGNYVYKITAKDKFSKKGRSTLTLVVVEPAPKLEKDITINVDLDATFSYAFTNLGGNVATQDGCQITPLDGANLSTDIYPVTLATSPPIVTCLVNGTADSIPSNQTFRIIASNNNQFHKSEVTLTVQSANTSKPYFEDITLDVTQGFKLDEILVNLGESVSNDSAGCKIRGHSNPISLSTEATSDQAVNPKFTCRIFTQDFVSADASVYTYVLQTKAAINSGRVRTNININVIAAPFLIENHQAVDNYSQLNYSFDNHGSNVSQCDIIDHPVSGGPNVSIQAQNNTCNVNGTINTTPGIYNYVIRATASGITQDIPFQLTVKAVPSFSNDNLTRDNYINEQFIIANASDDVESCVLQSSSVTSPSTADVSLIDYQGKKTCRLNLKIKDEIGNKLFRVVGTGFGGNLTTSDITIDFTLSAPNLVAAKVYPFVNEEFRYKFVNTSADVSDNTCFITPAINEITRVNGGAGKPKTCRIKHTFTNIGYNATFDVTSANSDGRVNATQLEVQVISRVPFLEDASATVEIGSNFGLDIINHGNDIVYDGCDIDNSADKPAIGIGHNVVNKRGSCRLSLPIVAGTVGTIYNYIITGRDSSNNTSTADFAFTIKNAKPNLDDLTLNVNTNASFQADLINRGGAVKSCIIAPTASSFLNSLSASVSAGTCQVSGDAASLSEIVTLVMTASNDLGQDEAVVDIRINRTGSANLQDANISVPHNQELNYTITNLGDSVNAGTCNISGTPASYISVGNITIDSGQRTCYLFNATADMTGDFTYTVTADSIGGITTADIQLTVFEKARFSDDFEVNLFTGEAFKLVLGNSGNDVVQCAIAGSGITTISTGITIDSNTVKTCLVDGTAGSIQGRYPYKITGVAAGLGAAAGASEDIEIIFNITNSEPKLLAHTLEVDISTDFSYTFKNNGSAVASNGCGINQPNNAPILNVESTKDASNNVSCRVYGNSSGDAGNFEYKITATDINNITRETRFVLAVKPVVTNLRNASFLFTKGEVSNFSVDITNDGSPTGGTTPCSINTSTLTISKAADSCSVSGNIDAIAPGVHDFKIIASTVFDNTSESDFQLQVLLQTPTIDTLASLGNNRVDLQWNSIVSADEYRLYYSTSDTTAFTLITTSDSITSYVHTGLKSATTYYYYVQACYTQSPPDVCSSNSNIKAVSTSANTFVGHYPFDGNSSNDASADISGNNNHAKIFGTSSATNDITGASESARSFSSTGSYFKLDNALNDSSTGSILMWLNLKVPNPSTSFMQFGDGGSKQKISITGSVADKRKLEFDCNSASLCLIASSSSPARLFKKYADNTWFHFAMTVDDSASGQIRAYKNGKPEAIINKAGNFSSENALYFFYNQTLSGTSVAGAIDDLKIYTSALSVSAVQDAMGIPYLNPPKKYTVDANSQVSYSFLNTGQSVSADHQGCSIKGTPVTGTPVLYASFISVANKNTCLVTGDATSNAGTYRYQVSATNQAGRTLKQEFVLEVNAAPDLIPHSISMTTGDFKSSIMQNDGTSVVSCDIVDATAHSSILISAAVNTANTPASCKIDVTTDSAASIGIFSYNVIGRSAGAGGATDIAEFKITITTSGDIQLVDSAARQLPNSSLSFSLMNKGTDVNQCEIATTDALSPILDVTVDVGSNPKTCRIHSLNIGSSTGDFTYNITGSNGSLSSNAEFKLTIGAQSGLTDLQNLVLNYPYGTAAIRVTATNDGAPVAGTVPCEITAKKSGNPTLYASHNGNTCDITADLTTANYPGSYKYTLASSNASDVTTESRITLKINFASTPVISGVTYKNQSYTVTWDALAGADRYEVYSSITNAIAPVVPISSDATSPFVHSSSTADQYFWIKACYGNKYCSEYSNPKKAGTDIPVPFFNISAFTESSINFDLAQLDENSVSQQRHDASTKSDTYSCSITTALDESAPILDTRLNTNGENYNCTVFGVSGSVVGVYEYSVSLFKNTQPIKTEQFILEVQDYPPSLLALHADIQLGQKIDQIIENNGGSVQRCETIKYSKSAPELIVSTDQINSVMSCRLSVENLKIGNYQYSIIAHNDSGTSSVDYLLNIAPETALMRNVEKQAQHLDQFSIAIPIENKANTVLDECFVKDKIAVSNNFNVSAVTQDNQLFGCRIDGDANQIGNVDFNIYAKNDFNIGIGEVRLNVVSQQVDIENEVALYRQNDAVDLTLQNNGSAALSCLIEKEQDNHALSPLAINTASVNGQSTCKITGSITDNEGIYNYQIKANNADNETSNSLLKVVVLGNKPFVKDITLSYQSGTKIQYTVENHGINLKSCSVQANSDQAPVIDVKSIALAQTTSCELNIATLDNIGNYEYQLVVANDFGQSSAKIQLALIPAKPRFDDVSYYTNKTEKSAFVLENKGGHVEQCQIISSSLLATTSEVYRDQNGVDTCKITIDQSGFDYGKYHIVYKAQNAGGSDHGRVNLFVDQSETMPSIASSQFTTGLNASESFVLKNYGGSVQADGCALNFTEENQFLSTKLNIDVTADEQNKLTCILYASFDNTDQEGDYLIDINATNERGTSNAQVELRLHSGTIDVENTHYIHSSEFESRLDVSIPVSGKMSADGCSLKVNSDQVDLYPKLAVERVQNDQNQYFCKISGTIPQGLIGEFSYSLKVENERLFKIAQFLLIVKENYKPDLLDSTLAIDQAGSFAFVVENRGGAIEYCSVDHDELFNLSTEIVKNAIGVTECAITGEAVVSTEQTYEVVAGNFDGDSSSNIKIKSTLPPQFKDVDYTIDATTSNFEIELINQGEILSPQSCKLIEVDERLENMDSVYFYVDQENRGCKVSGDIIHQENSKEAIKIMLKGVTLQNIESVGTINLHYQ